MQMEDGGWAYSPRWQPPGMMPNVGNLPGMNSTATMTCAGLLALAITDGATLELLEEKKVKAPAPDLSADKNLRRGLGGSQQRYRRPQGH